MWLVDTAPVFTLDVGLSNGLTVTVTVTRADGTTVASGAATTDVGDGTYTYTLAVGDNTRLDVLRLDWTVAATSAVYTTFEEIVGSHLFTIPQAKAHEILDGQTPLSSATDLFIRGWRETITNLFEQRTGRSWISRYCRIETSGNGTYRLPLNGQSRRSDGIRLHRPGRHYDVTGIIAASIDGTTQTVSELVVDGRAVRHSTATWSTPSISDPLNITVEYVYGLQHVHQEAQKRALELLMANASPGAEPSRATSFSNDDGTYEITTFPVNVENFLTAHDVRAPFA